MKIQIKSRYDRSIIVETDAENLGQAVLMALSTKLSLCYANLCDADLCYADLRGADLRDANLIGAKNIEYSIATTRILPEGELIGWKKCLGDILVKLLIPADSKRSNAFGRKCRCEFARVIEIIGDDEARSTYDDTLYRVGETVRCKEPFCEDFTQECASGIHFFITRTEAENYYWPK